MKITKYEHACVLVEDGDKVILFDPGDLSWKSGLFSIDDLSQLDQIVITHAHGDHLDQEFIGVLIDKFPDVQVVASPEVQSEISDSELDINMVDSADNLVPFTAPHENIPWGKAPANSGFHLNDKLTDPGDSHSFNETKEVLLLPFTAPWGSITSAVELAIKLKPAKVIPIHDWHIKPDFREAAYQRTVKTLAEHGIEFIVPVNGEAIDI